MCSRKAHSTSSHQGGAETLNEEQDHVLEKSDPFPSEDPFTREAGPSTSENTSPGTWRMRQEHRLRVLCWIWGAKEFRQAFTEKEEQVPWLRKEHVNKATVGEQEWGF